MLQFLHSVKTFLKSDDGPTAVEYAVMLAFVFRVCVVAIGELGTTTLGLYTTSLQEIQK